MDPSLVPVKREVSISDQNIIEKIWNILNGNRIFN